MKVVDNECHKRSHKVRGSKDLKEKKRKRCRTYFRTFVNKGKDMKTLFEKLKKKPRQRRCKGKGCRKSKSKSKPKSKSKSKQKRKRNPKSKAKAKTKTKTKTKTKSKTRAKTKTKTKTKQKPIGGQLQMYSKHKHPTNHKQKPRFRSLKTVNSDQRNPLLKQQKSRIGPTKM